MKDLTPLLAEPGASLAIVGATDHPSKYGGIIYRDLKAKGFPVFAVNPYRNSVDGDPCWAKVSDIPTPPTIVVLVVPAKRGMGVIEDAASAGIRNIWIQPGAFSMEMKQALEAGDFDWLAEACVMVRARTAVA
ncbi:MAG: CoA-binding protein [Actinomycetota bacterium]|nr:CoA-binding protein [Actinomycetota bacterium]